MNIKVKAGLEVTGFIASAIIIGGLTRFGLNYLSNIYGSEQVVNALACMFVGTVAYVAVSLLYDIRVSQLKYKAKLTEMVKK